MASMYESALTKAASDLESRGYTVQIEPSASSRSSLRADILGWGVDPSGTLRQMVAVEILTPGAIGEELEKSLSRARRQLRSIRDYFGTRTNFVYDGEKWLELSENFLEFTVSPGPEHMSETQAGCVTDIQSITNLIGALFRQSMERLRNGMEPASKSLIAVEELIKNPRISNQSVYLTSHPTIGN